jgi:hypothetical protein
MAETTEFEVLERSSLYKIWKNPDGPDDPIRYLGDFYPPQGRPFFLAQDLVDLGFGPGEYTIRVPERGRLARLISKWQTVRVEA